VVLSPGDVLELSLAAENLLLEDSFPIMVELIAKLQNGDEYSLKGPIPPEGVPVPAESILQGVMKHRIPAGLPDGFMCILKTVLLSSETGNYVDEDRCNLYITHD
jgi:hypothetical protein